MQSDMLIYLKLHKKNYRRLHASIEEKTQLFRYRRIVTFNYMKHGLLDKKIKKRDCENSRHHASLQLCLNEQSIIIVLSNQLHN